MVLYLKLNEKKWASGDYTNSATYDISGTIYTDDKLSSTASISSFTPKLYFMDSDNYSVYSTDSGIDVSSGSGVFTIKFSVNNAPTLEGSYRMRITLEDSNNRLTCVGVNGSDSIFFE
ncbi:MAG: hypothetical protein ACKO7N_00640 [Candidatus Nitrosotenuis sp.]